MKYFILTLDDFCVNIGEWITLCGDLSKCPKSMTNALGVSSVTNRFIATDIGNVTAGQNAAPSSTVASSNRCDGCGRNNRRSMRLRNDTHATRRRADEQRPSWDRVGKSPDRDGKREAPQNRGGL